MYSVLLSIWEHLVHDVDCIHDQGQIYTFIRIAFSNTSTGRNCMMSRQKLAIHQLSTTVFFDDFLKMFGSLLKLVKYQIESCCNDGVVEKKAGKGST